MSTVRELMSSGTQALVAQALVGSVTRSATATGTTQSTALPFSTGVIYVTTAASGSGVRLNGTSDFPATIGDEQTVFNYGANTLAVYPPVGESIAPNANNTSYNVLPSASCTFKKVENTTWVPTDSNDASGAKSIASFGASPAASAAVNTAAIQAAHDDSVLNGYTPVLFPAGAYDFTSLTWSPHVQAIAVGKVYMNTALASGRCVQISDQYGRPTLYGLNSVRNTVWDGQFHFQNTDGANTAIAWSFGGATNSYYCALVTPLNGVETRGFLGGAQEWRYNAFGLDFYSCLTQGCGDTVTVGSSATNNVTASNFFGCRDGSTTTGYTFNVDSPNVLVFNMHGCESVYNLGIMRPGKANTKTAITYFGGNLEWDQVSDAGIDNDGGATVQSIGSVIHLAALAGWPSPAISKTTNASTTRILDAKYILGGNPIPLLHQAVSATSVFIGDEYPNVQNGNNYTTFATYAAGSIGQTIYPRRDPTTGWSVDYTDNPLTAITAGGTVILTAGGGVIDVCNDDTGDSCIYRVHAANVSIVDGDATFVAGAAGLNQIGLVWNGTAYQFSNGYATTQHLVIGGTRLRASG